MTITCKVDDFTAKIGIGGVMRYSAVCTCMVIIRGKTKADAAAAFQRHISIPPPPADVLARRITKDDVRAFLDYFFDGPGYVIARATDCGHGYYLTDSCPLC